MARHLLGLPLHYLYYLKDFEGYDGIDDRGFQYLLDKYTRPSNPQLRLARAGLAWAAKNPGYDFASVAPYDGYPYTQDQFYFYLRRFHETLEEIITERGYQFPAHFDESVIYFNPIEQAAHRITTENGLLVGMKGPLDTTHSRRLFGPYESALYVLKANGVLLSMPHGPAGVIHHSTLAGEQPIACAGDIRTTNGRLLAINRRSGHYKTTPRMLEQVVHHLQTGGVDLTTVEIDGL